MRTWTSRVVGLGILIVAGACHHQAPETAPPPVREVRPVPPPPRAINGGQSLVRAMEERYSEKWYRTLSFTQRTTTTGASGTNVQTWKEYLRLPGELRIDFVDPANGGGVLYAHDSVYIFAEGKLTRADSGVNDLLVLGFDAYTEPVSRTEAMLRRRGFDLERFHETTWRGEPVYVVGALAGDTTSKQFWVDRKSLLFVRLLQHTARGESDIRFEKYVEMPGGGWVATQVDQLVNGSRRVLEEYSDLKAGVALSRQLFNAGDWTTAPKPPGSE